MHNLRNTEHAKVKFRDAKSPLTATAWDPTSDALVLAFGPTATDPAITLKRLPNGAQNAADTATIASWDAPSPNPDIEVDRIQNSHYFPDTQITTLVLAAGDIVVVREDPQPGEDLIEIVGSVDAGISAAEWSPEEELLAIATGAGTLIFMTREFESVSNVTLSAEDLKVSSHVSVGWGKKETQFKGRGAAKALRDPTVPEHVDEGTLSPYDDGSVAISWRGDGEYVAINSVLDVEPKRRVIRVYSRDGVLESVSEPTNGLEAALSWKPSGQLIAAVQRQNERIDIVFFERNGLRHGEFSLRLSSEELESIGSKVNLSWNCDSTVLAVSMTDRVQLWTMGNYHYYLKQEIMFVDVSLPLVMTVWHPEKSLQLCSSSNTDLRKLAYKLEVCRGSVSPPHDIGLVAVVDGKKLKLTPLRITNIPPPMAFDEIELPENALDVAISEDGTEIAILHCNSVSMWQCNYATKPPSKATLKSSIDIPVDVSDQRTSDVIAIPGYDHLFTRSDHDRIFHSGTNELSLGDHANGVESLPPKHDLSGSVWRAESGTRVSFRFVNSGILHVEGNGNVLRIPGCTSYIVTQMHLIYTTTQHLLKFVHLHEGKLEIPNDEPEKDERCRTVERGAKIITVIPSAYSLVLQMPRGNLETVYPRALVLAGIRQSIRDRDYKKAFLTCRTHRVDMNILHDYRPDQFMHDVELFVKQVKKTEYIDLLLSSLSEDDVSKTMYRETLSPHEEPALNSNVQQRSVVAATNETPKINRVCDAFLHALRKRSPQPLQNIVTAHVCKAPPDLEAGLRLVSDLRIQGEQEGLEEAVEHICFLADVNQLYDAALGLYDLDVALLVAQQSQKDPREYLPYLQNLNEMTQLRRQFAIDDDLKRYGKALTHLHALQVFDEVKGYVIKHDLYNVAIELYRYDDIRLTELMRLHADYLRRSNRNKEAGTAYEYVKDHSAAYEAYRAANMWQECLTNAALVPIEPTDLSNLAQDLAGSLEEAKDFTSAAMIYMEYLDGLETAVKLFCKAYRFSEAMRYITARGRLELLRVLDSGLVEGSAMMTEMFAEMKSQLAAQVPRLRELREKKVDDPMAFLDGADGDIDAPDNISLAPTDASTTGGTFMTRYTNRSMGTLATNATRKTSKNKRREERKRARGKKGTVYEEEYLVNSIARLIERLNDVGEDAVKLVDGLMRRMMRERAVAVQTAMDEVTAACKDCMKEVFLHDTAGAESDTGMMASKEATTRPWGGEGVLFDALTSTKREMPMLKSFERLSL